MAHFVVFHGLFIIVCLKVSSWVRVETKLGAGEEISSRHTDFSPNSCERFLSIANISVKKEFVKIEFSSQAKRWLF